MMTEVGRNFLLLAILGLVTSEAVVIPPVVSNLDIKLGNLEYNEDADLMPRELIEKYGYRGETHIVTTEDGYILTMHRITGPKSNSSPNGKQPVLLMHGLLCSSIDWIITGPQTAFGYQLANEGYDVWLGNARGNTFSRKHRELTVLDKKYWQFSWHEIGIRDIPAMIDYVLEETKRPDLIYAGHSQGTTAFWVMAAERTEYQDKVKAMFALAPVAYTYRVKSPFYHILAKFGNNIEKLMSLLGHYEFEPTSEFVKDLAGLLCDDEAWAQGFCENIIFLIAGFGSDQLNTTMLPAILGHIPAGVSVKQIVHYGQLVNSRKFQQYDHGIIGNLLQYKQLRPPDYDLGSINVPVYLHYSSNDWLAAPQDVDRLSKELGNVVGKFRVPYSTFGHLDFIWGKDAVQLVTSNVMALMEKYRN